MGGRGVGGSWVDVGVGRDGSDVLRQIANCTLLLDESIAVNRSQLKAFKGKHQMNLCCILERQSWVQLRIFMLPSFPKWLQTKIQCQFDAVIFRNRKSIC